MKIELKEISIREVSNGYLDNDEEGVVGYNGKLNIRPKYQREFVYNEKQQIEVINSIMNDYPLNVMYWITNSSNSYELLDGQQRTLSICKFVNNDFSINHKGYNKTFNNLTKEEQEKILDYKLMIYFCEGTERERLDWFRIINIAGEKLTDQELRNAIYTGEWLTDAKKHFSKTGCAAYGIGSKYMNGSPIRQDYLETVLKWISKIKNEEIEDYMSRHQHETNANKLWLYFSKIINWLEATFPNYRSEMKGVDWGLLYNAHKDDNLDPTKLEKRTIKLMQDPDVTNKKGIYSYLLNNKEKHLNIRVFNDRERREAYEKQKGICVICKDKFKTEEMEADHITPWYAGGKTNSENCQMLCKECNRRKSGK